MKSSQFGGRGGMSLRYLLVIENYYPTLVYVEYLKEQILGKMNKYEHNYVPHSSD